MRKSLIYNWWLSGSTEAFPEALKSLFSVLWIGQVSGSTLVDESGNGNNITITGKDFGTSYIPPTSTATFALANSAPLKVDDNFDGVWYSDAGVVNQVPVTSFINKDFTRTLVKYSNTSPYNVEWIGLLDDAASPTTEQWDQLFGLFQLHTYWSGVFNNEGYNKDNRVLEGQGFKGWVAQLDSLALTRPSTLVQASINKFCLELINAPSGSSVLSGMDVIFNMMLNDSGLVTGAGTVSLQNPTRTRMQFYGSPTYTTSGFTGDGTTAYADTFYNTSLGTNFVQNSASMGIWKYAAGTSGGLYGHLASAINGIFIGSSVSQRINSSVSLSGAFGTSGTGYKALNRTTSNDVQGYNPSINNYTNASSSPSNDTIKLMRNVSAGYGNAGLSLWYAGRSFTQAEHTIINNAFTNHKTRLGL